MCGTFSFKIACILFLEQKFFVVEIESFAAIFWLWYIILYKKFFDFGVL